MPSRRGSGESIIIRRKTLNSDAYIKILGNDKTIASDAFILKSGNDKTINSDAFILLSGNDKTLNSDAFILDTIDKTINSDAFIKILANEETFASDAFILKVETKTILSDAVIFKAGEESLLSDAFIKVLANEETINSDAFILLSGNDQTILSDAFILKTQEKTLLSDANILGTVDKTINSDAYILLSGNDQTILSDAVIFVSVGPTVTKTILSDSYIKVTADVQTLTSFAAISFRDFGEIMDDAFDENLEIEEFGKTVTYRKYDVDWDNMTGDLDESSYTEHSITAEVQPQTIEDKYVKSGELEVGDAVIFLPARITSTKFKPKMGDHVIWKNIVYIIDDIQVERIGSNEIFYECFGKRKTNKNPSSAWNTKYKAYSSDVRLGRGFD